MEQKTLQLIQLSVQDLTDLVSSCIANKLEKVNAFLNLKVESPKEELLTRDETSKLLKISLTTLWKHSKSGTLPAKKIGHKVYYFRQDVMNRLNSVA
ncbi:helix-turn-helix domain-containing protein [Flavobacterium sp. PL12]|uniref:helix-turn-helix domain-containing protein n=1 Tax=Flavobacterium sp. PL12 TaxID=3071718 RepID=UPI00319DD2E4